MKKSKIKTILYIGSEFEHSIKEKGDSLNKRAYYSNFIKLGYKVTPIWYDTNGDDLQNNIIEIANDLKPDMVFFVLQETQIDKKTLVALKKNNHFMVNYFGDDQWRFNDFSKYYANYLDVCITTDKFSVDKYKDIGQKNIIRSQWASLGSDVEYKNIEYKYDVSFIGGSSTYRVWFVNELSKVGIKVHCFGDRWDNGRVSYEEMEHIFVTSKINLNISNSTQYDIRYLLKNPRNILNTLRGKKNVSQTKARIFEIPVHGGFELTEYVPSIEDYFNLSNEIRCYKDIDEAKLLINYYLSHNEEREAIRTAGIKRARKEHTFYSRVVDFMKEIEEINDN